MKKKTYIIIGVVIALILALVVLVTLGYWYRSNIEGNVAKIFGKEQKQEELKAQEIKEKAFKVDKINDIEIETYIPEDETEMVKKTDAKIAGSDIYYNGVKNVFLVINDDMDKKHELFELLNKVENKKELLGKIEEHLSQNYNGSPYPYKCMEIKIYKYKGKFDVGYIRNKLVQEKVGKDIIEKRREYDVLFTYKKIRGERINEKNEPLLKKMDEMAQHSEEVTE